jgi:hypothetical protein
LTTTPVFDKYKVAEGVHTFTWVWKNKTKESSENGTARIDDVIVPRAIGHMEGSAVTQATGENNPLINATVTLTDGVETYTTTTDEKGKYAFFNIPYGDYTLTIEKDDFQTITRDVTVGSFGIQVIPVADVSVVDISSLYSQEEMDQAIQKALNEAVCGEYSREDLEKAVYDERMKWDVNGDNRIDLGEAIRALQVLTDEETTQ